MKGVNVAFPSEVPAAALKVYYTGRDAAALRNQCTLQTARDRGSWDETSPCMAKSLLKFPCIAATACDKSSASDQRYSLVRCGALGKHAKCG